MMTKKSDKPSNFWGELKRRKVVPVLAMYAASAFIILEVVDIVSPALQLPSWTVTFVVVLLAIGFPIVAILSWIFDITPAGIRKTESVDEVKAKELSPINDRRKLRTSDVVISILVITVLSLLYPKIFKKELFPSTNVPSIGVLYLKNLGNEADEYFSYGITEDIIIDLTKAGMIRVPTMNDILAFRESDKTLEEIAKILNVRYILTGSLRNDAGFMRLALQLVEPQKGINIWGDRWEEPLENVSGVKGKIIDEVIQSLGIRLKASTEYQIKRNPTTNPDAYEFYLKANYRIHLMQTEEDLEIVRGLYSKAIELDSIFIPAIIELGETYRITGELDLAMKHFKKALHLASSLDLPLEKATALIDIGDINRLHAQYDESSRIYEEALEIAREQEDIFTEGSILRSIGIIYDDQNQFDEALNYFQQSLSIAQRLKNEKMEYTCLNSIGIVLNNKGERDEALEYFEESLAIRLKLGHNLSAATVLVNMSVIEYDQGNYYESIELNAQAYEIYEKIGSPEGSSYALLGLGNSYFELGNLEEAISYLNLALKLAQQIGDQSTEGYILFNIANAYIEKSDYQYTLDLLNQALDIFNSILDDHMRGNVLGLIGITYFYKDEFSIACEYFSESVGLLQSVPMNKQVLLPESYHILSKIESGGKLDIDNDLEHLELIIDSVNMRDVSPHTFWNLYKIYKLQGNTDNGKKHLKRAYENVSVRISKMKSEADKDRLITNKDYQDIIEEWEKFE